MEDLQRYEQFLPIKARPATLAYRLRKAVRRHFPLFVGSTTAILVAGSLLVWKAWDAEVRRADVDALLTQAESTEISDEKREELLGAALRRDPDNALTNSRIELQGQRRRAAQLVKEEKQRQEQARLQSEIDRQNAEREVNAAHERERARVEAEQQARASSEARARKLVDAAARESDPLGAISDLSEALALLPAEGGTLRAEAEAKKVELALGLARDALKANEVGLARFWIREAAKLAGAKAREAELAAVLAEADRIQRGEQGLEEARALARSGDWLAARVRLEQARAQGIAPARLRDDVALVEARCGERAQALTGQSQSLLARGETVEALARAREALRFAPGLETARALVKDSEARVATEARREAAALWREARARSLAALERAERTIEDAKLVASLRRERDARAKLADDRALDGLVLVPEVPDLQVDLVYIARTETTNFAFKEFVDAGGYAKAELWDEAAKPLLTTFRDGCPGGACAHRGPRTWVGGDFGDRANGDRPVRGVTFWEARAFARWLSLKTGGRWRLPTEREWEAAAGWDPARGRLRAFPWGDEWNRSAPVIACDGPRPASEAGADESALGLLHSGGNVIEWIDRAGEPGTKGAAYGVGEDLARHLASVRTTGSPGACPPPDLAAWVGFRLAREVEVGR
jgi:hypothetical protein